MKTTTKIPERLLSSLLCLFLAAAPVLASGERTDQSHGPSSGSVRSTPWQNRFVAQAQEQQNSQQGQDFKYSRQRNDGGNRKPSHDDLFRLGGQRQQSHQNQGGGSSGLQQPGHDSLFRLGGQRQEAPAPVRDNRSAIEKAGSYGIDGGKTRSQDNRHWDNDRDRHNDYDRSRSHEYDGRRPHDGGARAYGGSYRSGSHNAGDYRSGGVPYGEYHRDGGDGRNRKEWWHHNGKGARGYEIRHKVYHIPSRHPVILHGRDQYHYFGGRFYLSWGSGFILTPPPIGLIVLNIPVGSRTVISAGVPYYVCGDVYYRRVPVGYEVVEPIRAPARHWPDRVAVATNILNLRYGPDSGEEIIVQVDRHTVLRVLGSSPGWLYVEIEGENIRGWVMEQYVTTNLGRG